MKRMLLAAVAVVALAGAYVHSDPIVSQSNVMQDNFDRRMLDTKNYNLYIHLMDEILLRRSDDIDRYCTAPRKVEMAKFEAEGGYLHHNSKEEMDYIFKKYGGACVAAHGWDNPDSQDSNGQFKRIAQPMIRKAWTGDKKWLEWRFCVADLEGAPNSQIIAECNQ